MIVGDAARVTVRQATGYGGRVRTGRHNFCTRSRVSAYSGDRGRAAAVVARAWGAQRRASGIGWTRVVTCDSGCKNGGDDRRGRLEQEAGAHHRASSRRSTAAGGGTASNGCTGPAGCAASCETAQMEQPPQPPRSRNDDEDADCRCFETKRAAGAKDQRFNGRHGDAERLGDLSVRPPLELAHHDRGTLIEGQLSERFEDLLNLRPLHLRNSESLEMILERNLVGASRNACIPAAGGVVRNRDQPVLRLLDLLAALHRAVRVQEGRLCHVLRVGRIAKQCQRIAIDVVDVPPIEGLERPISRERRKLSGRRRHYSGETADSGTGIRRRCLI